MGSSKASTAQGKAWNQDAQNAALAAIRTSAEPTTCRGGIRVLEQRAGTACNQRLAERVYSMWDHRSQMHAEQRTRLSCHMLEWQGI